MDRNLCRIRAPGPGTDCLQPRRQELRPLSFAIVIAVAASIIAASPAAADELTAQCNDPEASTYLQTVFDDSEAGDVVTLQDGEVCNANVLEEGEFVLPSHTIVFQGAAGGAAEVMDGDDEVRILRGSNVGTTVIRNLTFQNGESDEESGAAIEIRGNSAPTLSNLTILGNDTVEDGPVTISTNNSGGTVTVEESTFGGTGANDGNSGEHGGGLLINTAHSIVLHHNTFTGNVAEQRGGGAVLDLDVEQDIVERGIKGGEPTAAAATITDNTFSGNSVEMTPNTVPILFGGGLAIQAADPQFWQVVQSGNTFSENRIVPSFFFPVGRTTEGGGFGGYFAGGGEYTEASVLSTNDRFVNNLIEEPLQPQENIAQDGGFFFENHGGGIAISGRSLTLEGRNLVVAGNEIPFGQGGGVSSDSGFFRLATRSSVAEGSKGDNQNTLLLYDSTIVANDANDGTGSAIYGNYDDDLLVHNGIVFGNTSTQGQEIDGFDDGGTIDIQYTDYCDEDVSVPSLAPAPGEGNICEDPQLVDPPNGDVHQKKGLSPTLDAGKNDLVPEGLTGDWDRPTADARIADSGAHGNRVDMGADELIIPAPPTVTPPAPAAPPQAGAVLGATQRSCISRRVFRIRLRVPRGKTAVSATVRVNGKQVKVVRGKRLRAPVVLRGLPKGNITVKISIRLKGGKRVNGTRRYNTCIPRIIGDGPPPV